MAVAAISRTLAMIARGSACATDTASGNISFVRMWKWQLIHAAAAAAVRAGRHVQLAVVCNTSSLLKAHLMSRQGALPGSTLTYSKRKLSYVARSSYKHLVVLVWAGEHLSGILVPFVVKRALKPDCVTRVDVPFHLC